MAWPLQPLIGVAIALVAAPLGFYSLLLGLGVTPFFQKHFLYAHKVNTWWTDLNKPESWGFAKNQVTPFGLTTCDNETLYSWHILPLPLYLKHESTLEKEASGYREDVTESKSFQLLRDDPESKLILYFHGNAGHITQGIRPDSYHTLTDTSNYHVVAIDYRGFGRSTGNPSENGLILDASSLVEWAVNIAGVSPNRIVLLGQSLGTAVVSGVAEKYALKEVEFAGIILVAGFSDLASMLSGYRIAGLVPAFGPFAAFPSFNRLIQKFVVDKWHSANRLSSIVLHTKSRLRLIILHAKDDKDIPWKEDNKLFRAAALQTTNQLSDQEFDLLKEERTVRNGEDAFVTKWTAEPDILIRQELYPYGGHNNIMGFSPVILAVMRCFES